MRKKALASAHLAALRTDHELCDAFIVTKKVPHPPKHRHPFFKNAVCGEFKEGKEKTLDLKDSCPETLNIILDFGYGIFTDEQLEDFNLRFKVLKDSHLYQINGLHRAAFLFAMQKLLPQHIVPMLQHV